MRISVGSASDIGQVREGNEDSLLIVAPLYAVADGMGGHRGGEVASHLALETVRRLFEQGDRRLAAQIAEANRAVFERSLSDRSVAGMGTTLTAALVNGDHVQLAHVGDSRAYLFRDGELALLTEDHTLVHRMVMEGEITREEAQTHPHRSILTRALGVDPHVQVDQGEIEVRDGDRLLLCTDGLTGMVPDGEIRKILSEATEPQDAVDRLIRSANRAGGIDNITAVILDFSAESPERAAISHRPTAEHRVPPPTASTPMSAVPSPRGLHRVGVWGGAALAVLVLGAVGLRMYLDSQWFVGVSNGRVAIFRGIPGEIAGFDLHTVVLETSLPAEQVRSLAVYRKLPEGITAEGRDGANAIVEQIRQDLASSQLYGS
jgi:protein phosphatase